MGLGSVWFDWNVDETWRTVGATKAEMLTLGEPMDDICDGFQGPSMSRDSLSLVPKVFGGVEGDLRHIGSFALERLIFTSTSTHLRVVV